MKREWTDLELTEHWTLLPAEAALLANKTGPTLLGFAALPKFFQPDLCGQMSKLRRPGIPLVRVYRKTHSTAMVTSGASVLSSTPKAW
jgi:hypothetical protein